MPDENSKLGKMSKFFKDHFGNKKSKPPIKNKEEAPKSHIQKNFKEASKETKNSTWKPIITADNLEKFQKALKNLNDQKIKSMNSIKASILYTKVKQVGNKNASSIKALSKPRPAANELRSIIEATEFDKETQDKLLTVADRIEQTSSVIWPLSVKTVYHAFKNQRGSKIIAQLLNTKDSISVQQEKNIIQAQLSPDTSPTNPTPDSSKNPTFSEENSLGRKAQDSTPHKSTTQLPKPVVPTHTKLKPVSKVKRAPILKQILDSLIALNSSIRNKDWNATLPIQISNLRSIINGLIAQSKQMGQHVVNAKSEYLKKSWQNDKTKIDKLGTAITTILNVLNGEQLNNNKKNECIAYFENPLVKDPAEIRLSREIAINLNILFKWCEYTRAKAKMRQTPKGSVKIGGHRGQSTKLKQNLGKLSADLNNIVEESTNILKGGANNKITDNTPKNLQNKSDIGMWGKTVSDSHHWGNAKTTDDLIERLKK